MQRIIFATTNENKMKEIREILADFPVEILSLKEAGIQADIDENGSSFEENAAIKAEAIERMTGAIVLADDSGLEIDYLNGEPGIYSARYMGEETSYHIKNANLIERLAGVPDEKRPDSYAVWQRLSRTEKQKLSGERLKAVSAIRRKGKMASAMIRSFMYRNMVVQRHLCLRRRRMPLVTEERHCS